MGATVCSVRHRYLGSITRGLSGAPNSYAVGFPSRCARRRSLSRNVWASKYAIPIISRFDSDCQRVCIRFGSVASCDVGALALVCGGDRGVFRIRSSPLRHFPNTRCPSPDMDRTRSRNRLSRVDHGRPNCVWYLIAPTRTIVGRNVNQSLCS